MKKLKIPSNLTTLAYTSIKEYILEGRLDEDSRLTEEFLSTQLGISKSPIREALNRLETEGLIRIEPRKGAYLRRLSSDEVHDLYDIREALETHVVRTAKLMPALFAELHQSLKRQRSYLKANDRARYLVHTGYAPQPTVVHPSLGAILSKEKGRAEAELPEYDLSSSTALGHHEAIVTALEQKDRDKAETIMREHIQNVRRRLVEFLESRRTEQLAG